MIGYEINGTKGENLYTLNNRANEEKDVRYLKKEEVLSIKNAYNFDKFDTITAYHWKTDEEIDDIIFVK